MKPDVEHSKVLIIINIINNIQVLVKINPTT